MVHNEEPAEKLTSAAADDLKPVTCDPLWSVQDVAEWCQVSEDDIYNEVWKNEIPFVTVGRNVRFHPKEVVEWVNRHRALPERAPDADDCIVVHVPPWSGHEVERVADEGIGAASTAALSEGGPLALLHKPLLSVQELAELLQLSVEYVYCAAFQRELPVALVGTSLQFRRKDVVDWLGRHRDLPKER